MSTICIGHTAKNKPCFRRVTNHKYCHDHIKQEIKNVNIQVKQETKNVNIQENKDMKNECSICLCDVDDDDNCWLICGHRHHNDCISRVIKRQCPMCRGPLKFIKPSQINVNKIKAREEKEKLELEKQAHENSIALARELSQIRTKTKEESVIEESIAFAIQQEEKMLNIALNESLINY